MEDANFFVSAPSAASGGSCKSPSSVNSATGAPNTAAVVGGQASFEPHTEFAFPPIGMGADVSTFFECFVYFVGNFSSFFFHYGMTRFETLYK